MKKFRFLCLILALVLLLPMSAVRVLAEPEATTPPATEPQPEIVDQSDASVWQGCNTIDGQKPLMGSNKMLETAQGAFLYEVNTDTVVYAWNPDKQLPPAALVKMLTCILAVENGNLDDQVTVTQQALSAVPEYYHGDMGLIAGEVFTLRDLLYLTMVNGSNDAAAVVAEHIAGSQAAFVQMMNDRAKEIGCTNSNFIDVHGIKQTNQYTTARDVAKIVRECMKNEEFMVFFSTQRYKVPATEFYGERIAVSTHLMMQSGSTQIYYNKRITGARTGVTQERWRTIATTSQSGDLTYISVVLCAVPTFHEDDFSIKYYGSYEETLELLNLAYGNMRKSQIMSKDQITIEYPIVDGLNYIVAGPNSSTDTVLPSEVALQHLEVRYLDNYTSLRSPVQYGDKLTVMQLWYNGVCLAQSDVIAKNSVLAIDSAAAIEIQENSRSSWTLFFVIAAVILGAVLVFLLGSRIMASVRRAKVQAMYKRRASDRRRSR